MYKQGTEGYTLMEILLVVMIIGILAIIAYPSYSYFILKSHRTDALIALLQDQIALERCYMENKAYNKNCDYLPLFPQKTAQGYYHIHLTSIDAKKYILTATPIESQNKDETCNKFSVDQANIRRAEDAFGTEQNHCWNSS